MNIREHANLAPLTSLGVGGTARFVIEAQNEDEIEEAIAFARTRGVPLLPLGRGTNILVPDQELDAVVLMMGHMATVDLEESEMELQVSADAACVWDEVVRRVGERGVYGIENLAGIPGSVAGAVVQNIGAYGAELGAVFSHAECIDAHTGARVSITREDAALGYRTSVFKTRKELVIVRVHLALPKGAGPNLTYPDLARALADGTPLDNPLLITDTVRAIRARKFPSTSEGGTAGSFFKNPVISKDDADVLASLFPNLPAFPQSDGRVKVSLAWLFDHVLNLKGYREGAVRLFERQPIVIVVDEGASAEEVDAFAMRIEERTYRELGIRIEREVETFGIA